MINIEIKAKCSEPNRIREILVSKGADFKGTDNQTDTYYKINKGRLKLREGNIENGLIYYERENKSLPKESNYLLYKTHPHTKLKKLLIKDFGILTAVEKQREIYFINNVKFHIDIVKTLGSFVEIEATDGGGKIKRETLEKQCSVYMKLFGIKSVDLISGSYSDMIMASGKI